jgi:hypothetical protein
MEAWNSGAITTWSEPLFGPLPLQLIGNATRHRLYTVRYSILSKLHSLSQQLPAVHNGLRFLKATSLPFTIFYYWFHLKVLTNEKRGGMTVVSFDRSRFKGTVSRDFLLLVFFMNQFPPSPRVSH